MRLILYCLVFIPSIVFGTTRIVKQDGYQGAFASIQSAIDSAQDGDSVVVFPRFDGFAWNENLLIDKEIILTSAEDTSRLKMVSNVAVKLPDGGELTLIGFDISPGSQVGWNYVGVISVIDTGGSAQNRNKLNIVDCHASGHIYARTDNYDISILGSEIGNVYIRHGKILGSRFGSLNIDMEAASQISNDSLLIVGNICNEINISSLEKVKIYNNYLSRISFSNMANSGLHSIVNNTILYCNNPSSNTNRPIWVPYNSIILSLEIINNIICCPNGNQIIPEITNSYPQCNFKYNAFVVTNYLNNNCALSISEVGGYPYEIFYKYYINCAVIDQYGRLTSPEVLNKGYYLPEYTDIDLTRNDLGTYGGPYSINNFHYELLSSSGKGRVHWLDIPRTVNSTTTPINITGEGHVVH